MLHQMLPNQKSLFINIYYHAIHCFGLRTWKDEFIVEFNHDIKINNHIIPILIDDRVKYHRQFKSAGGEVIPWDIHNPGESFERATEKLNSIISRKKKND